MFHIFSHLSGKLKGKFDIAFIKKGRIMVFSNQGYNRRSQAVNAIKQLGQHYFQDDSGKVPVQLYWKDGSLCTSSVKPRKTYYEVTGKK